jgi:TatD DNase family protein
MRGKRNEPAFVRYTHEVLAQVKGVTVDEMAKVTTENFLQLFSKVPPPSEPPSDIMGEKL